MENKRKLLFKPSSAVMEEPMVRGHLGIHPQLEATKTFRDFRPVMFNNNCSKITICRSCSMEGRDPSTVSVSHHGITNFFSLCRIIGGLGKFGEGGRKLANLLGAVTVNGLFSSSLKPLVQCDSPASSAAALLSCFNGGCVETQVLSLKCYC